MNKSQSNDTAALSDHVGQTITINQLRAGRALARLGVRELARAAGLSATALSQLETGRTRNPHKTTLFALRVALAACGVDFASGGWIRHSADACADQNPPARPDGLDEDSQEDGPEGANGGNGSSGGEQPPPE